MNTLEIIEEAKNIIKMLETRKVSHSNVLRVVLTIQGIMRAQMDSKNSEKIQDTILQNALEMVNKQFNKSKQRPDIEKVLQLIAKTKMN